jgi:transcriptional regulator with XRE-family HTH domain
MKTFGQRIRELREAKDISLREFAKKLDLSAAFLSDVELGRRFPSDEVLTKIAKALDESVEKLKALDTRPPMDELRRLWASDPLMGVALRKVAEKNVTASDLLDFLKKAGKKK